MSTNTYTIEKSELLHIMSAAIGAAYVSVEDAVERLRLKTVAPLPASGAKPAIQGEPVPGVVLNRQGKASLVGVGEEDLHVQQRGAKRLYTSPQASPDGGAEIGPAGCDMEKRWAVPFDDIEDEQIRSLWQTTDTGDIEDDILSFARSLLALAADRDGGAEAQQAAPQAEVPKRADWHRAIRTQSLQAFREWLQVTGALPAGSSWIGEVEGLIADAVDASFVATTAQAEAKPRFSCHLERDFGKAPCDRDCGKLRCMYPSAEMSETMEQKTARNIRVQTRYDELMRAGKHGHYETMFRVVREEVERATPLPAQVQPAEQVGEPTDEQIDEVTRNYYGPVLGSMVEAHRVFARRILALASSAQQQPEVERLRAEQAQAVMPLIGPLLDAWDGMDNDTKGMIQEDAPDLAKWLKSINQAMESGPAQQQPVSAEAMKRVTPEMRKAFRDAYREGGFWSDRLDYALDKMLCAALSPQQAEPGKGEV